MLTGKLRNQVDKIWLTFHSGGVTNPLAVIEQFTYLLFIRRLDDIHTLKEKAANAFGTPIDRPVMTDGIEVNLLPNLLGSMAVYRFKRAE